MKSSNYERNAPSFLPPTAEVIMVDEDIKFDGNVIPHAWAHRITTITGSADALACMVLAEIVYWYRGVDVMEKGKIIGRKRKFEGDYLQKSYDDLAEKLNLTKGQVSAAVIRLEKMNLIKRDFRTLNIRGLKMSNVLFIRLFASQVCKISNTHPDKAAGLADQTKRERYEENSGDLPAKLRGEHLDLTHTSTGPVADKYKEHFKDHASEHLPGEETAAAAESAGPTPPEFFSILKENTGMSSTEPGSVHCTVMDKIHTETPVNLLPDHLVLQTGFNDAKRIRPVLEQAFGGLKFIGPHEVALESYITEGRITLQWAEALLMAKMCFDQDRDRFKTKGFFIPVKPTYLIRDYDRTVQGILGVLGEQHSNLEMANRIFDREDLQPHLQLLKEYDHHFVSCLRGRKENDRFVAVPGHENDFENLLIHPERFVYYKEGDEMPPVWMRMIYAYQRNVYTHRIRITLLETAQTELRSNPTGLEAMPDPLSDEQIHTLFALDMTALRDRWEVEYKRRDALMEKLNRLISEVLDLTASFQLGVA